MAQQDTSIMFEGAQIMFKNLSGKEGKYNRAGDRNFCLFLDPQDAAQLAKDGWNVKELKPLDEQEDPQPYIQVTVGYKGRPPKIVLVSSKGKTPLDEDTVNILDWADLKTVDLIIRPYQWEVNGKTGIKAYLKSMYAILEEDDLDRKYAEVPDSGAGTPDIPNEVDDLDDAPF